MKNLLVILAIAALLAPPLRGQEIIFGWNKVNESGKIYDMEFMPDNDYFVLVTATDLQIRESETGELVNVYPVPEKYAAHDIEFTPDSTKLILMYGNTIELRDISDMSIIKSYIIPPDPDDYNITSFRELKVDPVRPLLYTVWNKQNINNPIDFTRKVLIFNYETLEQLGELTTEAEESQNLEQLTVSIDGKYLAVSNGIASHIHVWNLETQQKIRYYKLCDDFVTNQGGRAGNPYCMKFSEINTDNIYLSGEFPKSKDEIRFEGLILYNIQENKILDSTFAVEPQRIFEGYFTLFNEEEKALGINQVFLTSILLKNKETVLKIRLPDSLYILSKTIYSKVDDFFIGYSYYNSSTSAISMFEYDSGLDIIEDKKIISTIYPNPTNDQVTLNNNCTTETFYYEIYDINGLLLKSSPEIFSGEESFTLDFSSYPSGIYFLKIFCGSDTTTYKIIKEM